MDEQKSQYLRTPNFGLYETDPYHYASHLNMPQNAVQCPPNHIAAAAAAAAAATAAAAANNSILNTMKSSYMEPNTNAVTNLDYTPDAFKTSMPSIPLLPIPTPTQQTHQTHPPTITAAAAATTINSNISLQNEDISNGAVLSGYGQKRKNALKSDENAKQKKMIATTQEEKKISHLRKNIRDVMNEKSLDMTTLAAQREESERLARVADQQKSIREVVNKQFFRMLNLDGNTESTTHGTTTTTTAATISTQHLHQPHHQPHHHHHHQHPIQSYPNDASISIPEDDSKSVTCDDDSDSSLSCGGIDDVFNKDGGSGADQSNEVVTIEDSSDDDCIMLSEEEEEEEDEDFNEPDDAHNSGMHVKDAYNIPDECGRVVVNIAHPEGEETIYLAPQIAKIIKPHQIGGVRFLYDNIIESTRRFQKSSGFGCILAHSMGLGKTLQVVSFCDIFLRHTTARTVLCVMPINTLQNWLSEFNMWIPRHTADPSVRPRNFDVFVLNDQQKTLTARSKVILNWSHNGGVLLIGYELFRLLALKLVTTRKRKSTKRFQMNDGLDSSKDLMNVVYEALVKPGPDLVICDEGHRIKNSQAGISLALKQIRTRRRVVLTGYPLQNNLLEYWCMVDFVRPNYLGTRTEFCNMFERPIQNGQCVDSTPDDIKLMRYRAHVLHSLLLGFVQRRSHIVLQSTLPEKLEYVILIRMTPFQRKLYDTFMTDVVRKKAFPNPLKAFAVCCKIWNHPDVLYNFLKKCETDLDLDEIDEESPKSNTSTAIVDASIPPNNLHNANSNNNTNNSTNNNAIAINANINNGTTEEAAISKTCQQNGDVFSTQTVGGIKENYTDKCTNYFSEKVDQMHNFPTYSSEGKANNYWLDSTIPSKPSCVEVMMKPIDSNTTKGYDNITGSSEIVDLDTNEIKTVETNIQTNPPINEFDKIQTLDGSTSNSINSDLNKKVFKKKINDDFSCSWAVELMKNYIPGQISNSPKMEIFFCIMKESIYLGDRILLFSQSLLTLNLIEGFLKTCYVPGTNNLWTRNISYFRLDGSTSSQERERLVNEFNANMNIKLFLISTRAGSLGINLTGANRVIIFDASWNPCHDTQAVYRIYRYGQRKRCYIYRIVMDKCLEKKIYDRQIKKQGMSDRIVDECNPEAHLSIKDITNLCHDYDSDDENEAKETKESTETPETGKTDTDKTADTENTDTDKTDSGTSEAEKKEIDKPEVEQTAEIKTESSNTEAGETEENKPTNTDFPDPDKPTQAEKLSEEEKKDKEEAEAKLKAKIRSDSIINTIIESHKNDITKEPFFHESLLVDRKDRKLSQAEKRQAHRSYELEKKASVNQKIAYTSGKMHYKIVNQDGTVVTRPVASIRPMQTVKKPNNTMTGGRTTRWIPAEVWQRQGMTAQEMTLPLDVVIPTNSSDKANIILKAGQRVMVLKSSKGIYMQLDSGKIIAIRTTTKPTDCDKNNKGDVIDITSDCDNDTPKPQSTEPDMEKDKCSDEKLETTTNKDFNQTNALVNDFTDRKLTDHQQQQQQQQQHYSSQSQQSLPNGNSTLKPEATTTTQHQHQHQVSRDLSYAQPQQQQQSSQPQPQPQQQQQPQQTQQQQQQTQQPQSYKHQSQLPLVNDGYNSTMNIQSNMAHPQAIIPPGNGGATDNAYFPNRDVQHSFPLQYYDYYDNKSKPTQPATNYHLNDYTPYSHFNFSPYHSNLHTTPAYAASGGSTPYTINSNVFPRPHWNPVVNTPTTNESFRQQSYLGSTYPLNEWSSQ